MMSVQNLAHLACGCGNSFTQKVEWERPHFEIEKGTWCDWSCMLARAGVHRLGVELWPERCACAATSPVCPELDLRCDQHGCLLHQEAGSPAGLPHPFPSVLFNHAGWARRPWVETGWPGGQEAGLSEASTAVLEEPCAAWGPGRRPVF